MSFLINSHDKIWIIIFEDSTLTFDDIYRLQFLIPDSTIIDGDEYEAIILKKLLHYSSCYHYSKTTIYARKIFDKTLYDENDAIYIDSDIFLLKNLSFLILSCIQYLCMIRRMHIHLNLMNFCI